MKYINYNFIFSGFFFSYQKLVEQHNHDSFLHTLPERQHKQDERSGDLNMGKKNK